MNKAVLVAVLSGSALMSLPWPRGEWFMPGLFMFGLFNAVLAPAGTLWVRAAAIAGVLAALLWPGARVLVLLLAWLVWPPAFAVAWALRRESTAAAEEPSASDPAASRARIGVAALIAAVAIASFAYRLIVVGGLQQTAALFVGIPALLAIVVVFTVSPRTAAGVACKAVTIGLLVSLLFLGEGMLCVAMSAPLFYAIAVGIAALFEAASRQRERPTTLFSCVFMLALVPMSLEGVMPIATASRDESITETRIVHPSSEEVARALYAVPRFNRALPPFLRAGFPTAVATRIEREADGVRWIIQLRGGEMRIDGMEPRSGDLILTLADTGPRHLRWRAVSDNSHMTHFLKWREAAVQWEPVDAETTRVTWTLRYDRGLDPSWYFGPWERYAVRLAAGYLIDAVATP